MLAAAAARHSLKQRATQLGRVAQAVEGLEVLSLVRMVGVELPIAEEVGAAVAVREQSLVAADQASSSSAA